MRKHDVRKWLHAVLDLLPVILIPVFMIYSHRHTIDSGSIDVPQNQVVDFNQLGQSFNSSNWSPLVSNNITLSFNDNSSIVVDVDYNGGGGDDIAIYDLSVVNNTGNHIFITKVNFDLVQGSDITLPFLEFCGVYSTYSLESDNLYSSRFVVNSGYSSGHSILKVGGTKSIGDSWIFSNYQLFDLTQMFGVGNEPSLEQFNTWYTDVYYDHTLSHKELLKGTSNITYDDTDIMSQVVYQLYNSVDKYFNMGNVFNLTGVYDWFNLNIFNGNAPISIYIVWNIVLYEFVMDLLFLLYGLFMWFIDMVEKIMDKPFKSIK